MNESVVKEENGPQTSSVPQTNNGSQKLLLRSVFTAMFAALICAGAFISIPMPGGVPIVLQNMLVVLSGILLGPIQGAAATGIFLIAGALGLPVFSGGVGGIAILLGPTGGFLIGYFFAALVAGLISGSPSAEKKTPIYRICIAAVAGLLVIYVPGVLRLQNVLQATFPKALSAGMIPFLPGDLIKVVILIPLGIKLKPIMARYLFS
ncbi:MAG: biotin transporter BioY [Spirochaetaceae bacterium]|jgi:biotin transport system substrate-specific component|nr:biotin transporter BioY [Spirochaetaceae bacterium]